MSERTEEGFGRKKRLKFDVTGGVAVDAPTNQVNAGQYVQQRMTRRGEALVKMTDVDIEANLASEGEIGVPVPPTSATLIGGIATAADPVHLEGRLNEVSLTLEGDIRTTITQAQAAEAAAAPDDVLQVGGRVETVAPNPADDTLASLSLDSYNGIRARIDRAQGTHGATVPGEVLMQGQYAEATVPTALTDGDVARPWYDLYGRPTLRADDLATLTLRISDVAPALVAKLGPVTFTQIDEPGVTAATNIRNYKNWCFQVVVAGTPTATTIVAEGSHDGTNWFDMQTSSTAKTGLAVANNIGTISEAGVYSWSGVNACTVYIRLKVMPTSGSPESVTLDVQLMAGN